MTRTVVYKAGGFTNCGIGYTKFSQEELAEMKDRVMTENDAKTFLKIEKECINRNCDRNCAQCDIVQKVEDLNSAYDTAIKALEEVQQYRKHGITVESALNNMCDLAAAENLIEEYRAIGTPEECRVAMEKQIEEKPTAVLGTFGGTEYECKNCGSDVHYGDEYCRWCGQKLDWSDEE